MWKVYDTRRSLVPFFLEPWTEIAVHFPRASGKHGSLSSLEQSLEDAVWKYADEVFPRGGVVSIDADSTGLRTAIRENVHGVRRPSTKNTTIDNESQLSASDGLPVDTSIAIFNLVTGRVAYTTFVGLCY